MKNRDRLAISVRAFVPPPPEEPHPNKRGKSRRQPSDLTLIFDTETMTTSAQSFRFGSYQVRRKGELSETGIFYDAAILTDEDQRVLRDFAAKRGLKCMPVSDFIEKVFYGIGYDLRAAIVGFNLPYDISRLAIRHGSARGKTMRGGFTFQLSSNPWKPRVQVKHLSARAALIQFTKPRPRQDTRGMRKRGLKVPIRRGAFVDVKTIAAALTSRSFSLGTLADFLETEHRKLSTEEHGGPITEQYVEYAMQDVQVTWECYAILGRKFEEYGLTHTPMSKILSEASIGKACLREMGIRPWRELQPDFPDWLIGIIMCAYYGGRSEVHLRREITQVLYCDFLSMYPTVCTLMGLWRFVIAKGITWRDSTLEVVKFLESVTLADLQRPETWRLLTALVQILPEGDIFPVRASYASDAQATIGLNCLSNKEPMWFTLADCIVAKLLTGRTPRVVQAISFAPGEIQDDLKPIAVAGNPEYRIDPASGDFFRAVIDCRNRVKAKLKAATGPEAERLDADQKSLKIIANATSYGIFLELNIVELDPPEWRPCYGPSGEPFEIMTAKGEDPGKYFHPLIAALITGAARLMLGITETLAASVGLDWAFCDTDSMALAKPEGMDPSQFVTTGQSVCNWFTPLNPYEQRGPLLKIEDANYGLDGGKLTETLMPLFCFAVSAKRYALFNGGPDGVPVIRKASAHGLGHLLPPYAVEDAPAAIPVPAIGLDTIGVERWQYDLWYQIISAALNGNTDQVDLGYHPALDGPACSRYAATTTKLLSWFDTYNQNRLYRDRVRPFNFLCAFQATEIPAPGAAEYVLNDLRQSRRFKPVQPLKPIAPYNRDARMAAKSCFDRESGNSVEPNLLKNYREALAKYHLSPESKFLDGDYFDRGPMIRRHVEVVATHHIGKEANHWEEQHYLGFDEEEQIDYGMAPRGPAQIAETVRHVSPLVGQRDLAERLGMSRETLAKILRGEETRTVRKRAGQILRVLGQIMEEQLPPLKKSKLKR
jgi:hypothetical protein